MDKYINKLPSFIKENIFNYEIEVKYYLFIEHNFGEVEINNDYLVKYINFINISGINYNKVFKYLNKYILDNINVEPLIESGIFNKYISMKHNNTYYHLHDRTYSNVNNFNSYEYINDLIYAIKNNNLYVVEYIINSKKIDFEFKSYILEYACLLQNLYILKLLVNAGVNPKHNYSKCLRIAFITCNINNINYLISKGANVKDALYINKILYIDIDKLISICESYKDYKLINLIHSSMVDSLDINNDKSRYNKYFKY